MVWISSFAGMNEACRANLALSDGLLQKKRYCYFQVKIEHKELLI
jgi:hypothetical protein